MCKTLLKIESRRLLAYFPYGTSNKHNMFVNIYYEKLKMSYQKTTIILLIIKICILQALSYTVKYLKQMFCIP